MKKSLLTTALLASLAHAADTPEAAVEQLLQHILDGNGDKAAALTYIAPELRAEGVDEAAFKAQLAQCYNGNAHQSAHDSGRRLATVRAERNADGTQARLFATIRNRDGAHFRHPEALIAIQSAQGWQIDFVDVMLGLCPDLDVGDPRAVMQRYLDAWQRGDIDAAFALVHIDEAPFTRLPPADHLAKARQEFANFYQTNIDLKLRLGDTAAQIDGTEATVAVINDAADITSTMSLQKTAHGWRVRY